MLEALTIGALLLYANVFVRLLEPQTSVSCIVEPWTRELGFSILYGAITIKLYKIFTDFQTRKAHRVCFSDKDLVAYLLAIVVIVVGYMSAWTALVAEGFKQSQAFDELNSSPACDGQTASSANQSAIIDDEPLSAFQLLCTKQRLAIAEQRKLAPFASQLFAGIVEHSFVFDVALDLFVHSTRCRRLAWNYVTELSKYFCHMCSDLSQIKVCLMLNSVTSRN